MRRGDNQIAIQHRYQHAVLLLTCLWATSPSSATCPPRETCDFGSLPGYWRENETPPWQLVDTCCQLDDVVRRSFTSPASLAHVGHAKASILIFGDSVERITLHDLCTITRRLITLSMLGLRIDSNTIGEKRLGLPPYLHAIVDVFQ